MIKFYYFIFGIAIVLGVVFLHTLKDFQLRTYKVGLYMSNPRFEILNNRRIAVFDDEDDINVALELCKIILLPYKFMPEVKDSFYCKKEEN